jgi:pimeloyl-ACP methyl ester carboxylesterase
MKSYFVHNGPVKIHVLESGAASSKTPSLLVITGIWEPAERAIPILSGVTSHVVTLSLRGRGLSSTPEIGYGLEDHLSDIEAVAKHCKLQSYCVLGFSRGASYALGWSLQNQQDMSGLIIGDQPPVHNKLSPELVEFWAGIEYLGVPILNFMRRTAIEGLCKDAEQIDFSAQLSQLKIPVALFIGRNKESKIPSNISDETLQLYKKDLPSCEVVEFSKSGHMIPDDEPERYIEEITSFINKLEY